MKVVVGLGNPGVKYSRTRHNVGFDVIHVLSERLAVGVDKSRHHALIGEQFIAGEKVLLVKPQTFMNLSGDSIREIFAFHRELEAARDLIVVYDDMDFPVGDLRLRAQGSAGGHNGLKSIINVLGSQEFSRIRIGIGRPDAGRTVIDHVLSPFPTADRAAVEAVLERAADAATFAVEYGFALAMNRFNGPVDVG